MVYRGTMSKPGASLRMPSLRLPRRLQLVLRIPPIGPLTDVIPLQLRVRTLIDRAARLTGVSTALICGSAKTSAVVRARDAIAWVAHHALGVSSTLIARRMGGRDSSSISHPLRRAGARRIADATFRELTDQLVTAVREATTPALAGAVTRSGVGRPFGNGRRAAPIEIPA
jgi:hypothetical protein